MWRRAGAGVFGHPGDLVVAADLSEQDPVSSAVSLVPHPREEGEVFRAGTVVDMGLQVVGLAGLSLRPEGGLSRRAGSCM